MKEPAWWQTLWAETYWASDFRISVIGSFIKFPLMKYLVWSGSYFLYWVQETAVLCFSVLFLNNKSQISKRPPYHARRVCQTFYARILTRSSLVWVAPVHLPPVTLGLQPTDPGLQWEPNWEQEKDLNLSIRRIKKAESSLKSNKNKIFLKQSYIPKWKPTPTCSLPIYNSPWASA